MRERVKKRNKKKRRRKSERDQRTKNYAPEYLYKVEYIEGCLSPFCGLLFLFPHFRNKSHYCSPIYRYLSILYMYKEKKNNKKNRHLFPTFTKFLIFKCHVHNFFFFFQRREGNSTFIILRI